MGLDRRFWSGSVIVVAGVIAGASALPALLLRSDPAVDSRSVIAVPSARVAPMRQAEVSLPTPATVRPAAPQAAPAAAIATPQPPSPAPPVAAVAFPPVQPPSAEPPPTTEAAAPTASAPVAARANPDPPADKPARVTERAAPRKSAHLRRVRPAIYPIREFLAWRR